MLHEPSLLKLWHTYSGLTVKVSNFWKSKIATATILKITKIVISPQRFDRSLRIVVRWCNMGLITAPTAKNEFQNPRWRTAAILKTVKSPSLQSFDRFWWNLAWWCILVPRTWRIIKVLIFDNLIRWTGQPQSWESKNCLIYYVITHYTRVVR